MNYEGRYYFLTNMKTFIWIPFFPNIADEASVHNWYVIEVLPKPIPQSVEIYFKICLNI